VRLAPGRRSLSEKTSEELSVNSWNLVLDISARLDSYNESLSEADKYRLCPVRPGAVIQATGFNRAFWHQLI